LKNAREVLEVATVWGDEDETREDEGAGEYGVKELLREKILFDLVKSLRKVALLAPAVPREDNLIGRSLI
jgi:hypothetical protein